MYFVCSLEAPSDYERAGYQINKYIVALGLHAMVGPAPSDFSRVAEQLLFFFKASLQCLPLDHRTPILDTRLTGCINQDYIFWVFKRCLVICSQYISRQGNRWDSYTDEED